LQRSIFEDDRVAQFPNHRFFTPPKLAPLNLDLTRLSGGGWCPAEFDGETHDGRHVYCRYRGGWLQVWVANELGLDAYISEGGSCVLDQRIGPPLHGGLSLGQLCRYAGISINREIPPLPTEAEIQGIHRLDDLKDLGGDVTHYSLVQYSTPLIAQRLFGRLGVKPFDVDKKIADRHFFVGKTSSNGIAVSPIEESEIKEVSKKSAVFRLKYCGITRFSKSELEIIARDLGIYLRLAGHDEECLYGSLFLDTSFPATDDTQAQLAIEIDKILSDFFPFVQILCVDLKTGERRPDKDYNASIDAEVLKWIAAGKDRWIRAFWNGGRDKDSREYLGYRPQL
jgi:hypothetical protein